MVVVDPLKVVVFSFLVVESGEDSLEVEVLVLLVAINKFRVDIFW